MTVKILRVVRRRIRHDNQMQRWLVLSTIAMATLGTGMGFAAYMWWPAKPSCAPLLERVLDAAANALALLVFEMAEKPTTILFPIARLLTAVASVGGVLLFAWDRIFQSLWALRIGGLVDHTVVIGIGRRGRALLRTVKANERLVLVDRSSEIWPVVSRSRRTYAVEGDAKHAGTLVDANIAKAKTIMILSGDDDENLAILLGIRDHAAQRERAPGRPVTRIVVRIDNPSLARALNSDRRFTDPDPFHRVVAFNEDRLAVLRMFESHVMGELADLRGLRRQHLVVVGHTGFALEAMEHFVRLSPYKDFEIPRIDVLSADPDATWKRLAAMRPAMLNKACIHADNGSIERSTTTETNTRALVDLHIWPVDAESGLPEAIRLRQVEPGPIASVTAILVSADDDSHAVAMAMRLRSLKRTESRWAAPIFVRTQNDAAVGFVQQPPSRSLADRIYPVGLVDEIASLSDYVKGRDKQAKTFHEEWLREADGDRDRGARSTLTGWQGLPNSVKARNRRAVDHLRPKLYSAGFVVLSGKLRSAAPVFSPDTRGFRELAELEHRVWETDLLMDGWKHGNVRDDAARLHDLLGVPYEKLSPEIREHDTRQINAAATFICRKSKKKKHPTVLRETRIAMIGSLDVSSASRDRMASELPRILDSVSPGGDGLEYVSILTPMAPGADTIGSEMLAEELERRAIPFRLIVVESLPRHAMLWRALPHVPGDSAWSLHGGSLPNNVAEKIRIVADYHDALAPHQVAGGSSTADLQPPGVSLERWLTDDTLFENALRRANAYMVQRADVIVALAHESDEAIRPGSTREALKWAREGVEPPLFALYAETWIPRKAPSIHVIDTAE